MSTRGQNRRAGEKASEKFVGYKVESRIEQAKKLMSLWRRISRAIIMKYPSTINTHDHWPRTSPPLSYLKLRQETQCCHRTYVNLTYPGSGPPSSILSSSSSRTASRRWPTPRAGFRGRRRRSAASRRRRSGTSRGRGRWSARSRCCCCCHCRPRPWEEGCCRRRPPTGNYSCRHAWVVFPRGVLDPRLATDRLTDAFLLRSVATYGHPLSPPFFRSRRAAFGRRGSNNR